MIGQFKDWVARQTRAPVEFPATLFAKQLQTAEEFDSELKAVALFTYREGFQALPRSTQTTDKGWGCLIRTGQMLLHETLRRHDEDDSTEAREARLLAFRDVDDETKAPFSIHSMVRGVSNSNDKFYPEYWSPRQGGEAIRAVVTKAHLPRALTVHLTEGDGCLYNDEILFCVEQNPTLILVPMRTGAHDRIHQQAWCTFKHILVSPHCVGIVGGSPKRSYFFVGLTNERVLYLDPHQDTQPAFTSLENVGRHSELCSTIMALEWKRIDSSMVVGFYVKDPVQWRILTEHLGKIKLVGGAPLLNVVPSRGVANAAAVDNVETWE